MLPAADSKWVVHSACIKSHCLDAACSYLYVVPQGLYVSQVLQSLHSLTVRSNAGEDEAGCFGNIINVLHLRKC